MDPVGFFQNLQTFVVTGQGGETARWEERTEAQKVFVQRQAEFSEPGAIWKLEVGNRRFLVDRRTTRARHFTALKNLQLMG